MCSVSVERWGSRTGTSYPAILWFVHLFWFMLEPSLKPSLRPFFLLPLLFSWSPSIRDRDHLSMPMLLVCSSQAQECMLYIEWVAAKPLGCKRYFFLFLWNKHLRIFIQPDEWTSCFSWWFWWRNPNSKLGSTRCTGWRIALMAACTNALMYHMHAAIILLLAVAFAYYSVIRTYR